MPENWRKIYKQENGPNSRFSTEPAASPEPGHYARQNEKWQNAQARQLEVVPVIAARLQDFDALVQCLTLAHAGASRLQIANPLQIRPERDHALGERRLFEVTLCASIQPLHSIPNVVRLVVGGGEDSPTTFNSGNSHRNQNEGSRRPRPVGLSPAEDPRILLRLDRAIRRLRHH